MLTNIVKATRAHYAALQHRPAPDRQALEYEVCQVRDGRFYPLSSGRIWVKVPAARVSVGGPLSAHQAWSRRKAEVTRLRNRLAAMFPEATQISVEYAE